MKRRRIRTVDDLFTSPEGEWFYDPEGRDLEVIDDTADGIESVRIPIPPATAARLGLRAGELDGPADERRPRGLLGVLGAGGRHQEAGARVGAEVLGVLGQTGEEEERLAPSPLAEGDERPHGEPLGLQGDGGEDAEAPLEEQLAHGAGEARSPFGLLPDLLHRTLGRPS